jgi:hypothetical protein
MIKYVMYAKAKVPRAIEWPRSRSSGYPTSKAARDDEIGAIINDAIQNGTPRLVWVKALA